jgi:hypothetical protein
MSIYSTPITERPQTQYNVLSYNTTAEIEFNDVKSFKKQSSFYLYLTSPSISYDTWVTRQRIPSIWAGIRKGSFNKSVSKSWRHTERVARGPQTRTCSPCIKQFEQCSQYKLDSFHYREGVQENIQLTL